MPYDLNALFTEIFASDLYVQSICENYWAPQDPRWVVWLRFGSDPDSACKGYGATLGEALNAALNTTPTYNPLPPIAVNQTPEVYLEALEALDTLMQNIKPVPIIHPGTVRRL